MISQTKNDLKKIQDAIRMLGRDDRKTLFTTKVGDNPAALAATLTLIEQLCGVIREQEGLPPANAYIDEELGIAE